MLINTEKRLLNNYFTHELIKYMQSQKKDMKINIYILLIIRIVSVKRQKRRLSTYIIETTSTYNADL